LDFCKPLVYIGFSFSEGVTRYRFKGQTIGWLNEQDNQRLNLDNIELPNTKWVFVKFSNIAVNVVLDNQPMLGTGQLPD